jgi:hypothetical protein
MTARGIVIVLTMTDSNSPEACTFCGCTVIEEYNRCAQHCNGQWNERVRFKCGQEFHYSPNFKANQASDRWKCTQSKDYKRFNKSNKACKDALIAQVTANPELGPTFKARLLHKLEDMETKE